MKLTFREGFFEEEEICGFTVSSMMKRAWAVELEVLSEIDRICKKHELTYFAFWGTLIGAVRHGGFIPWDDDIDIAMKRADYQKLMEVIDKELPEGFYVSSSYHDKTHNQPLTSIMNTKTIILDEKKRERFYGCPYVCGIDIFPLDYVPRDKDMAEMQRNLYTVIYSTAQKLNEYKESGEADTYLGQIEELCKVRIERDGTERNQLWLLLDKVAGLFGEDECDVLADFSTIICDKPNYYIDKKSISEAESRCFEQLLVPVPIGYDNILRDYYGDYNVYSYDDGRLHDYPFYKKQEEFLRSRGVFL